jgi:hypothetical protein
MLMLKSAPVPGNYRKAIGEDENYAKKQLAAALKGDLSLLELERMQLSEKEVARFLVSRIPVMRAAALAGRYAGVGFFLEEMHRVLIHKADPN